MFIDRGEYGRAPPGSMPEIMWISAFSLEGHTTAAGGQGVQYDSCNSGEGGMLVGPLPYQHSHA